MVVAGQAIGARANGGGDGWGLLSPMNVSDIYSICPWYSSCFYITMHNTFYSSTSHIYCKRFRELQSNAVDLSMVG